MKDQNKANFLANLVTQRATKKPAMRKRTKRPKLVRWLYPYAIERRYKKEIIENVVNPLTEKATTLIESRYEYWLNQSVLSDSAIPKHPYIAKDDWHMPVDYLLKHKDDMELEFFLYSIVKPIKLDISMFQQDDWIDELNQILKELEEESEAIFGAAEQDPEGSSIWPIIAIIGTDVFLFNKTQWQKSTSSVLGFGYESPEPWFDEAKKSWTNTNYNYLHNYSVDYRNQLQGVITRGIQNGLLLRDVMEDVKNLNRKFENKAELLARDQTGKLNGIITKQRQISIGVNYYVWYTVADERVRPTHREMDGYIMDWSDSTVYADTVTDVERNENGDIIKINWQPRNYNMDIGVIPGQAVLCRCFGAGWYEPIVQEADEEIRQQFREPGEY